MDIYREHILDHYQNPRHHSLLQKPTHKADGANPLCGDELTLTVRISKGKIADIGFSGRGCSISQAATSMLCEFVVGKTVRAVEKFDKKTIYELLGIPLSPTRLKCALLSLATLKSALGEQKIAVTE